MLAHNVINNFKVLSSKSVYNIYEFLDKTHDKITNLLLTKKKNKCNIEQKAKIKFNMLSIYTKCILISSVSHNRYAICNLALAR